MSSIIPTNDEYLPAGKEVDRVTLDIDYQIIEHFSKHLYRSPNKAIEELVSNSFDAFAENVYVYLPGKFTSDSVVVCDDGESMNIDGLKNLWLIANSPKKSTERLIKATGKADRSVIGKFGIGKLASYAVGNSITHLCKSDGKYFSVEIDYSFLDNKTEEKKSKNHPYFSPIKEFLEEDVKKILLSILNSEANLHIFKELLKKEKWTIAIIRNLKTDLYPKRISWLLSTGMPLRSDFSVFVNDEKISSKLESSSRLNLNLDNDEIINQVKADWKDYSKKTGAVEDLEFGEDKGLLPHEPNKKTKYIKLPNLGKVTCHLRVFEDSVLGKKSSETGRSHGVFLFLRGRLVNESDDKYLLEDPNFGVFYRIQISIYFDNDTDLLADREKFKADTKCHDEMRLLISSLYKVGRKEVNKYDETNSETENLESLLPIKRRDLFKSPIISLLNNEYSNNKPFNFTKPEINRTSIGHDEPLSVISPEGKGFSINTSHPYNEVIEKRIGNSKTGKKFIRFLDLFSISEVLLKGFLYDIGISPEKIKQVASWRDNLFRHFAETVEKNHDNLATDLMNESYNGKKPFENALSEILKDMGFRCEVHGQSGEKDILVTANIGPDSFTFTFEAKGGKKPVPNDDCEVGGANSHRKKAGAEHSIIVAREFVGFKDNPNNEEAAILQECKAINHVSIMTVEAIIELHKAVMEYNYPLDVIKNVFTKIETPAQKIETIKTLQKPTDDFDYPAVLRVIYEKLNDEAINEKLSINTVRQRNKEWKDKFTKEFFISKLIALESLSDSLIVVDGEEVVLKQKPEIIIEHIRNRLNNG